MSALRYSQKWPHAVLIHWQAFMRGRNILEGVIVLYETIHELHRKNLSGVIFKIDFENAYDKVKWNFLLKMLQLKGFSPKWIEWIKSFISGGSVAINVNDEISPYFQTLRAETGRSTLTHPIQYSSRYAHTFHQQSQSQ